MLTPVIGRFAPSPTGELHLGSLITAVASFCFAKREQGEWRLRIEDVDTERCRPEFTHAILKELVRLGLEWDGEVCYQSQRLDSYHALLNDRLIPYTYGCDCTRKSIAQFIHSHSECQSIDSPHRYPQLCATKHLTRDNAIRLRLPDQTTVFFDQLQGIISGNPQRQHGDIVLRRRGTQHHLGMINYMLAAVVDDAYQGINQVVRGLDILPLTIPQLILSDYLQLPLVARYYHLPLLLNEQGQKLSKQTLAEPIAPYSAQSLIQLSLNLLGQPPVDMDNPRVMLSQAITQWDSRPLIGQTERICPTIPTLLENLSQS